MRWLYRLLDYPLVYKIVQIVCAPGSERLLKKHFDFIFQNSSGLTLDVGCGPVCNTPVKQSQQVCGLDINDKYVKEYAAVSMHWGVVGSAFKLPFPDESFDECRCFGMLHHLDDEQTAMTVREMVRCTKKNGSVIVIDAVWPKIPWMLPLAWLNHKLDRGQWIRTEQKFTDIVQKAKTGPWKSYRFMHSYIGHEALSLTLLKK